MSIEEHGDGITRARFELGTMQTRGELGHSLKTLQGTVLRLLTYQKKRKQSIDDKKNKQSTPEVQE